MSLTFNALSASPTYVFPATSADGNAATTNSGQIPEGALLMLPPGFDSTLIRSPALRKVAETLKTYGAYVVDRNVGTPYVIYVEIGSGYNLHGGKWNSAVANELDLIRRELRPVKSTDGWIDGNERLVKPSSGFNLLSMRGPWAVQSGSGSAAFDTWRQALMFPANGSAVTVVNRSNNNVSRVTWALPQRGRHYTFTVNTTGNASVKLDILDKDLRRLVFSTGYLIHGETITFTWPASNFSTALYASSDGGPASTAAATLIETEAGQ
jgi:hypothetical protein